jgi:hypothetical protein
MLVGNSNELIWNSSSARLPTQSVTSPSVSDADPYVIFRKLPHSDAGGKFKRTYTELFFRKVAYTKCDVKYFVEQMDFTSPYI